MTEIICITAAVLCTVISGIALAMACICWAKVVGMENSTHQIQYVPLEDESGREISGEILDKNMEEALGSRQHEKEYM
jgi:hypothetical protein